MLKIGLTGGIASGKSAVARFFTDLGAPLIDTDVLAREVVEPGTPGLADVVEAFGSGVLTADGTLDRRKLRSIVFADAAERRRLEALLHPRIRALTLERIAATAAQGHAYAVIAVPLLVESDFRALADRVVVVDVPVETQIARLVARDGVSREQAEAMIGAQAARETRLAAADDVIDNSGDLAATQAQVAALDRRFRQLATVC